MERSIEVPEMRLRLWGCTHRHGCEIVEMNRCSNRRLLVTGPTVTAMCARVSLVRGCFPAQQNARDRRVRRLSREMRDGRVSAVTKMLK